MCHLMYKHHIKKAEIMDSRNFDFYQGVGKPDFLLKKEKTEFWELQPHNLSTFAQESCP